MTEPRELPDTLTPCSPSELARGLTWAWIARFDSPPEPRQLAVLLAQWALETGRGRSCHCWNFGNVKHADGDGRCWTFFRCNEVIDGREVWFDPPHPACCFRAFSTLREGAVEYLDFLARHYRPAWPFVLAGDPAGFVHALKTAHYFTANETTYRNAVVSLYAELLPTITPAMIDDVAHYHDDVLSDDEREKVVSLVALTLSQYDLEHDGPTTEPSA